MSINIDNFLYDTTKFAEFGIEHRGDGYIRKVGAKRFFSLKSKSAQKLINKQTDNNRSLLRYRPAEEKAPPIPPRPEQKFGKERKKETEKERQKERKKERKNERKKERKKERNKENTKE